MSLSSQPDCIGIVLAGGQSSRMGQDKSQLETLNNQSMLDFSRSLLKSIGINHVVISGTKQGIADTVQHLGPVAGIYSVMSSQACKAALIIPVDLPLMTPDVLANLKHAGELSQKATYYTNHALPLYLPNNVFTDMYFKQQFSQHTAAPNKRVETSRFDQTCPGQSKNKKNGPSMKAMLSSMPHQAIRCQAPSTLTNTNTPEQWRAAQQQLNLIRSA